MKKIILTIAALFIFAGSVIAQSNTDKRFALVIGNQNYDESPLQNSLNDAKLIAETLKDCGFEVSVGQDQTKAEMENLVGEYAQKVSEAGRNTVSFFYYSGHGVQIDGKNYLVPKNDAGITSEIKAKASCYSLDTILELIPSTTQIIVLDACRNNPFKNTKENFSKGLSLVQTPRHVKNFLTFFSTQAGQTADDGAKGNSLFTKCLAERMKEMNTPVYNVFNEVADDVKTTTSGRQTPLVAGTSLNMELMNPEIAAAKIKVLQEKLKTSNAGSKNSGSNVFSSDMNAVSVELERMQTIKKRAEADKAEKVKKEKKEAEIRKKNEQEMLRIKKESETAAKEYQKQKAKQKSSYAFLKEIETNKSAVQAIRENAAVNIFKANKEEQEYADTKIDEVKNEPVGVTQKDAKGNMTSAEKKRRQNLITQIQADADANKKKNYDNYYGAIQDEEKSRLEQHNQDIKTLTSPLAKYAASSVVTDDFKEVDYRVTDYDGAAAKWTVRFDANLFGKVKLFSDTIDLPYEALKRCVDNNYVAPEKMNPSQQDDYEKFVGIWDLVLKGGVSPVTVEVAYTIEPSKNEASTYIVRANTIQLLYFDSKEAKDIVLSKKSCSITREFKWIEGQTALKDVTTLIAEKEDAVNTAKKRAEEARIAEEKRKAAEIKENERQEKIAVQEAARQQRNAETSAKLKKFYGSNTQTALTGFDFGINVERGFGFHIGYAFGIFDNFFVEPYIGIKSIAEEVDMEVVKSVGGAIGVKGGVSYTFELNKSFIDPYLAMNLGFVSGSGSSDSGKKGYFDFGLNLGAAWIFEDYWGFRSDIGFTTAGDKPSFSFNLGLVITQELLEEWLDL